MPVIENDTRAAETAAETENTEDAERERRPRTLYLDVLRCYAIVLVVLLHAMVPFFADTQYFGNKSWLAMLAVNPFCRTAVAIFFMISGYLLLTDPLADDIKAFYKKRLPRLIVPLLAWNLIYYAYYAYAHGIQGDYASQFLHSGTAYHMWYVYTLIGIYLFTPFLKKIINACTKGQVARMFLLIFAMSTVRPFINDFAPVDIHLFEPLMLGYFGFILLGYLLGSVDFKRGHRILFYIGGAAGYVISVMMIYTRSTTETIDFSINMGYSLPRYLLAAAVFVLAKQLFRKNDGQSRAAQTVTKCAGLIFGVYWVHVLVLEELTARFFIDTVPIVEVLVRFALTFAISAVLTAVMHRIKLLRRHLL